MSTTKVMLLGAAAWAAAFIVVAVVFRGRPAGDWIESALLVGFIIFLSVGTACSVRDAKLRRGHE